MRTLFWLVVYVAAASIPVVFVGVVLHAIVGSPR